MDGGSVGFVVGGFKHQGNAKAFTDGFVMACAVECEVQVFQNIHAAQQDKGSVVRERDVSELNLARHDCVPSDEFSELTRLN